MARVRFTPANFQPGNRLIDGSDLNNYLASLIESLDSGNTTANATTQAAAASGFTITAGVTEFSTAGSNPAFALPPSGVNSKTGYPQPNVVIVVNDTGSTISAFPGGASDVINGQAAAAAITILTARMVIFACISDVGGVRTWKAFGGSVSGNIT
jgi:hypothetical protein